MPTWPQYAPGQANNLMKLDTWTERAGIQKSYSKHNHVDPTVGKYYTTHTTAPPWTTKQRTRLGTPHRGPSQAKPSTESKTPAK